MHLFARLATLFALAAIGAWVFAYYSDEWFSKSWLVLIYPAKMRASLSGVTIDMKGFKLDNVPTVEAYSIVCGMNGVTFDQLNTLCEELFYIHLGSMFYIIVGSMSMMFVISAVFMFVFGSRLQAERVAAKLDKRLSKIVTSNPYKHARNLILGAAVVSTLFLMAWGAYFFSRPKTAGKFDVGLGGNTTRTVVGYAYMVALGGSCLAIASACFATLANNDDINAEHLRAERKDQRDREMEKLVKGKAGGKKAAAMLAHAADGFDAEVHGKRAQMHRARQQEAMYAAQQQHQF